MSRFCEQCDITLDLHPWPDDEDDPGCQVAADKERLINGFLWAVVGRHRWAAVGVNSETGGAQ